VFVVVGGLFVVCLGLGLTLCCTWCNVVGVIGLVAGVLGGSGMDALVEARGWLVDCGYSAATVTASSDGQVERQVAYQYDGGWAQFLEDIGDDVTADVTTMTCQHCGLPTYRDWVNYTPDTHGPKVRHQDTGRIVCAAGS
jgi:hypothetical protein